MLKSIFNIKSALAWLLLLVIVKVVLIAIFPYPNGDGIWISSHSFSVIRGEFFKDTFAYSYMDTYSFPYLYTLIISPFFLIVNTGSHSYDIFILHFILLCLLMLLSYKFLLKKQSSKLIAICFCILLFTNSYSFSLRPELFNAVLISIGSYLFLNANYSLNKRIIIAGICSAIAGISHPMGGIFSSIFFTYVLWNEGWFTVKRLMLLGATIAILVAVLYLPVILINVEEWKLNFLHRGMENDNHKIDFNKLSKFLIISICIIAFYLANVFANVKGKALLRELSAFIFFTILLGLFGRSYYAYYLVVFILYRLGDITKGTEELSFKRQWTNALTVALLLITPLFTHYILAYQLLSSPLYAGEYRKVLKLVSKNYKTEDVNKLVWVSPDISMPVMRYSNARMYTPHIVNVLHQKIELNKGDVILTSNNSMMHNLPTMFNITPQQMDTVEIMKFDKSIAKVFSDGNAGKIGLVQLIKK